MGPILLLTNSWNDYTMPNNNGSLDFMLHTTLTKYVLQSMKNFNASNVNLQLH